MNINGTQPYTFTDCVFFFLLQSHYNICIIILLSYLTRADMAELADALDLGSSVFDVRVQVPLSAFILEAFHVDAWRAFFIESETSVQQKCSRLIVLCNIFSQQILQFYASDVRFYLYNHDLIILQLLL